MASLRAFASIVLAASTALVAWPSLAQPLPPAAKVKREKVDSRAMVPGLQASDAASDARPAGALTRDQRKEATLRAREDGTLLPAGDAAERPEARPAPLAPGGVAAAAATAAPAASTEAAPTAPADAPADVAPTSAQPPAAVATAAPPASTKKPARKKARGGSGPTAI